MREAYNKIRERLLVTEEITDLRTAAFVVALENLRNLRDPQAS